ncbi:MAG: hypothetical protein J2P32_07185 [Actinobacteria bacterium]|nr:hypothetical protein [Actinomycetota bacterium]
MTPLWSLPLPFGGGHIEVMPSGGYVVSAGATISVFDQVWRLRWSAAYTGPFTGETTVVAPDGAMIRIENETIVTRSPEIGQVVGAVPVPLGSHLHLAPWGDLLYSQAAAPPGTGQIPSSLCCVDRTGRFRWSVTLDRAGPLVYGPIPLGDMVIVPRRGLLWAYDHAGQSQWVADDRGIREPRAEDEYRRPAFSEPGSGGVTLVHEPVLLDADRMLIGLRSPGRAGLYLLDGAIPRITGISAPVGRPVTVVPGSSTEFRVVGLGRRFEVSRMDWRYPIRCFESDGRELWEHRLPTEPIHLSAAPNGNFITAASATATRWEKYGQWFDLSQETFVRCLNPDGTERWTWRASGPITQEPAIGADGTIYVGAERKLWAFAATA